MRGTRRGGIGARVTDRVWTVPNALSFLRLACIPAFLVLLARHEDGWAFAALAISGASDFLDGRIARRYHQVSRLGQVLDPLADRLFIVSTVLALALRQIVPWWLVALILLRDVAGTLVVWSISRLGYRSLPTHFLGKAATFCLLWAFPLLLLAHAAPAGATAVRSGSLALGWAFAWWGVALYWVSLLAYLRQARDLHADEGPPPGVGGAAGTPPAGRESPGAPS